jgi:hypothetical protein
MTNSNYKSNGNNTNNANQQSGGSAKKKLRTELTPNQKKGMVLTRDVSYI